LPQKKRPEG